MILRVIKLGGSLLDWPQLPVRLHRWLAGQPSAANVLIVGGGPIVEGLRTIDRAQRLSAAAAHWLAIDAMSLTARVLVELLPGAALIETLRDVEVAKSDQLFVLDVAPLLRAEQGSHTALPESWDVTSDSIAAHVAHRLQAAELVLLKSTAAPDAASAEVLSAAGYVDAYFPQAAGELFVRCVNLRD
jgi:aspartokinase-like uncharacterized kinase